MSTCLAGGGPNATAATSGWGVAGELSIGVPDGSGSAAGGGAENRRTNLRVGASPGRVRVDAGREVPIRERRAGGCGGMSHFRDAHEVPGFRYSQGAMRLALPIVVLTALSGGCAVGQKIAYHDLTPALVARAPIPLTVVVQDERPEVSTLKKDPQFVGLMRGGWG